MAIKSIRIKNILSFDDFYISDLRDINCIVGRNNTGKTNLLKVIDYFYSKLSDDNVISLPLFSKYTSTGSITITYDTERIKSVVSSNKNKSDYQKNIYKSLFKSEHKCALGTLVRNREKKKNVYSITLTINKDGSIYWSDNDKNVRKIIKRIFPFYSVDTRRLDLYNWNELWRIVSELKFLNAKKLNKEDHIAYIDSKVSPRSNSYKDYIEKISDITKTSPYDYQELILNYIKVGLDGHTFNIDGNKLDSQSDGTNSHKYLELFLSLMIALTRREYIYPTVYIDEPEIGLHPKRSEELIYRLYEIYDLYKNRKKESSAGKYNTPSPTMILSTHSPNIIKMVIKLFNEDDEHKIIQFAKKNNSTIARNISSYYKDKRFLNVFSDNEARLFFSQYILFVEGETEIEIFGNKILMQKYPSLRTIDVYRTNEVMLKAINPNNSNLSIPYLVLYDADKMMAINTNDGSLNFLSKEVNLFKIRDDLKNSFWGSDSFKLKKRLDIILSQDKSPKDLVESKIRFERFNYNDFIKRVNKIIVSKSNRYITSTTIEGSLINDKSIILLIKWILFEFKTNSSIGGNSNVERRIDGLKVAYEKNGNVKSAYLGIYANPKFRGEIDKERLVFSNKIKYKYIRTIYKEAKSKQLSKDELVIIFRLIFEGKTDTLISASNALYTELSQEFKDLVVVFKDQYLKNFPCGFTKTGGWVTSFLNYSLTYMINNEDVFNKKSFNAQFKFYFPELYDIISHVSSSIE